MQNSQNLIVCSCCSLVFRGLAKIQLHVFELLILAQNFVAIFSGIYNFIDSLFSVEDLFERLEIESFQTFKYVCEVLASRKLPLS